MKHKFIQIYPLVAALLASLSIINISAAGENMPDKANATESAEPEMASPGSHTLGIHGQLNFFSFPNGEITSDRGTSAEKEYLLLFKNSNHSWEHWWTAGIHYQYALNGYIWPKINLDYTRRSFASESIIMGREVERIFQCSYVNVNPGVQLFLPSFQTNKYWIGTAEIGLIYGIKTEDNQIYHFKNYETNKSRNYSLYRQWYKVNDNTAGYYLSAGTIYKLREYIFLCAAIKFESSFRFAPAFSSNADKINYNNILFDLQASYRI